MIHGGFLLLPAEWTKPVQPLEICPYFYPGQRGLQGRAGVFKQILRNKKARKQVASVLIWWTIQDLNL